ncbi:helix-turn-helix transcriptional regulator [Catenuloplanes japonicus]|uniref:helix-turn-helix transcriptional regulator n=1 Tax=Catenuloplanes japonicus TaxID=33876 RepID=UPI0005275BF5|nr:helix-turn-helix transcriptional regulator [Catenuloplanes japonicus]
MTQRADLAAFLRARRARLEPGDVGLPDGARRRTPGLRRQEVAQLAGISIDYYIRLEQGRGSAPSRQILAALARALVLTRDERDYLFRTAGINPPKAAAPSRELAPAIRYLLDGMPHVPAYVVDARYDILAWNRLAGHLLDSLLRGDERNMLRWLFGNVIVDGEWSSGTAAAFTRDTVADLRASYAQNPGDPGLAALVTELLGTSPAFAALWADHDVAVRRSATKRVSLPGLGPLEYEYQVLHVPETGQRLITCCAAPGSPTHEVFRRLATADLP